MAIGFPGYQTGNLLFCKRERKIQFRTSVKTFPAEIARFCIKNVFVSCRGCHWNVFLSIDIVSDPSIVYDLFAIYDMDAIIHGMDIFCKKERVCGKKMKKVGNVVIFFYYLIAYSAIR